MNLTQARSIVRQFAPNAIASVYSDSEIDRAILACGNDFMRETQCVKSTGSPVTLGTCQATATFTSWSTFRPERFIDAELIYPINDAGVSYGSTGVITYNLNEQTYHNGCRYVCIKSHSNSDTDTEPGAGDSWEVYWRKVNSDVYDEMVPVSYSSLRGDMVAGGTGTPEKISFRDASTMAVHPMPGTTPWSVRAYWHTPFNMSYSDVGATAGTTVTLNIPEEYVYGVMSMGAPAFLNHNDPDRRYAEPTYVKYVQFRDSVADSVFVDTGETTPGDNDRI